MLVLMRKSGERIVIGEDIEILVCQIGQNKVKLGIEAPRDVRVRRGELDILPELAPVDPRKGIK